MKTKTKPKNSAAAKPAPAPKVDPIAPPQAWARELIPLDSLVNGGNHRASIDEAGVEQLAASLSSVGLLQAIGVRRLEFSVSKPEYDIRWGHRRAAAARRLGWTHIDCVIEPADSKIDIDQLALIENIQRVDPSPIDECMVVARMLDRHYAPCAWNRLTAAEKRNAIQKTAAALGKTEHWVADRAYMAHLGEPAQKAVLEERLPLTHARLIAQVADPDAQKELVASLAASKKGDLPETLDKARYLCGHYLCRLSDAIWNLTVPFAQMPACTDCPKNSANEPMLFELGTFARSTLQASGGEVRKEPASGICTSIKCYRHKHSHARTVMATVSAKAAKTAHEAPKKERDSTLKASSAQEAAGVIFLKPTLVAEHAEQKLERLTQKVPSRPSATRTKEMHAEHPSVAMRSLEREFGVAASEWARKVEPQVAKALGKIPGAWAMLNLVLDTKPVRDTSDSNLQKAIKAAEQPVVQRFLGYIAEPSLDRLIEVERACGRSFGLFDAWNNGRSGIVRKLCEALGVDASDAPDWEKFQAKAKAKGAEKAS